MKKLYFLFYFVFIGYGFSSYAQKMPNTLLWRISGNGLQKPSYLYGTLHLMDERIFSFGDSLFSAIEKSDGFAIEIHPDEMTPYIIDLIKQEIKNSRFIKDMMNEKEFKKYSQQLSKKLNKPADRITSQDIFREKNKWLEDGYRSGKMSTIVDAYLFDIARRQGKWMGGVEDMADQKGLIDNLIDESDIKQIALSDKANSTNEIEHMIQVYINGDLNSVDSMMNFTDSSYRDALLIKRNKKMAWRMDSLSRVRTMVFAVGTAHLPGAGGLISLLRNKGFSVEPVFYSRKIKSSDYTFKEVEIPWVNVDDPNGYYHVRMPGKPGDIQMYGLLDMKMYFNIFNSTGYLTASINVPYEKKGIDSMLQLFATNVFKEKKLQNTKDITINSISGKELEKKDEDGYKHGFILYKNNVIYLIVGFAMSDNMKMTKEVKKFLDSYKPVENLASNNSPAYIYVDSVLAYKVDLPSKPQSGADLAGGNDKTIRSNLMVCIDQQSGSYFVFGVNQTAPGYSITNDSASLRQIHDNVIGKYTNIKFDTTYVKNNHRVLEFEGRLQKADINAKVYYEFRGNRWYALVAMYGTNEPKPVVQRFLNSFSLLNYQPASWSKRISADSLLSTWAPSPIQYHNAKDKNDTYSSTRYEMYDSTRGDTYEVVVEDLGKYYWQDNDSVFWKKLETNSATNKDTLLNKNYGTTGSMKFLDIVKKEKGSFNISRKRTFLYGDTIYTLISTHHEENINDENINRFFSDFKFIRPVPVSNLNVSKAQLLLQDLMLEDSATRSQARSALSTAPFTKNELSLLHEALQKKYPSSENEYQTTNDLIGDKIIAMHESSSLIFAKKNYLSVTDKEVKNILLDIITKFKSGENYAELVKLLIQSPPSAEPSYSTIHTIMDSGKLAATIFPGILPLLKDTIMASQVIYMATNLIDSSLISVDMLKPHQQTILQYAESRLKKLIAGEEYRYNFADKYVVELLGKMKNPACNAMIKKWMQIDVDYLKIRCIAALVANGETIDNQILLKLAADKAYRVDLYDELKKRQKQQVFPKQYLTQQYFAQSMVYGVASEDDDSPSALTLLSQKIISFKGKKARFFFYKLTYDGDEKVYRLGCAGPFEIDTTKMSSDKANGALYYDEDYDASKQDKQIESLIKRMEED